MTFDVTGAQDFKRCSSVVRNHVSERLRCQSTFDRLRARLSVESITTEEVS
jgi:hypothetical protein